MTNKGYNQCIHQMTWCSHISTKGQFKQASAFSLPSAPEITNNHIYDGKMTQIWTFQATIDQFMALEDWLFELAWITYSYTIPLLCDSIAEALIPTWLLIAVYTITLHSTLALISISVDKWMVNPTYYLGFQPPPALNHCKCHAYFMRKTADQQCYLCHCKRKAYDSVKQRFSQNFAMDPIVFLGNNSDLKHGAELGMHEWMRHPIAFHAEMMGDIMYLHQTLKQEDDTHFIQQVIKEVDGHI